MLRDLGESVRAAASSIHVGLVELHGGDLSLAETELRHDFEFLNRMGEEYHLSSVATLLAQVVRDQGRDDEALELLTMSERLSSPDDIESQALWRSIRAPILARGGRHLEAEKLARVAVEMLQNTESPGTQADTICELATVLAVCGRVPEALAANTNAIALYLKKGNEFQRERRSSWAMAFAQAPE
jgi:ATP/maltotriose-dependent transcriptional regulator MalT